MDILNRPDICSCYASTDHTERPLKLYNSNWTRRENVIPDLPKLGLHVFVQNVYKLSADLRVKYSSEFI